MSSSACSKPEVSRSWRRHDFVRCHAGVQATELHCELRAELRAELRTKFPAGEGLLEEWLYHRRPLVVRRPGLSADGNWLAVGLATPPHQGKCRLPLTVPVNAIAEHFLPPLLAECLPEKGADVFLSGMNGTWPWRVFGSRAWQHLTGLAYTHPDSDWDMLLEVTAALPWSILEEGLREVHFPAHPRIDLEIIGRDGTALSWREWMGASRKILLKNLPSVWLEERADVVRRYFE